MTSPADHPAPTSHDVVARALLRSGPRVLLARTTGYDFWFLPGGPVVVGESAVRSLRRELRDELGLDGRVGDLVAVAENAYTLDGVAHHETNLVFDVRVDGAPSRSLREGLELQWFPTHAMEGVDIRPRSLANVVRYGPGASRLRLLNDDLPR